MYIAHHTHAFSQVHLYKELPVPCVLLHMSKDHCIPKWLCIFKMAILLNTLQASSSMLPHLENIYVNQATPTLPPPEKTSAPQPDSTNLLFMSLLGIFKCSKPRKTLQALSSRTKVKLSGILASWNCICWKSSTVVFSYCPALNISLQGQYNKTAFHGMKKLMLFCKLCLFHEKLSHCTVPGAIAASSTCTPKGERSLVPKPQRVVRLLMFEIRAPERCLSLSLCEMLLED